MMSSIAWSITFGLPSCNVSSVHGARPNRPKSTTTFPPRKRKAHQVSVRVSHLYRVTSTPSLARASISPSSSCRSHSVQPRLTGGRRTNGFSRVSFCIGIFRLQFYSAAVLNRLSSAQSTSLSRMNRSSAPFRQGSNTPRSLVKAVLRGSRPASTGVTRDSS
jgi:hypothetical protein